MRIKTACERLSKSCAVDGRFGIPQTTTGRTEGSPDQIEPSVVRARPYLEGITCYQEDIGQVGTESSLGQANIESLTMKKLTIITSLFSILAGVMLTSCASDKPVTQSTTTTRQTTVTEPAATQTTTTHTTGY